MPFAEKKNLPHHPVWARFSPLAKIFPKITASARTSKTPYHASFGRSDPSDRFGFDKWQWTTTQLPLRLLRSSVYPLTTSMPSNSSCLGKPTCGGGLTRITIGSTKTNIIDWHCLHIYRPATQYCSILGHFQYDCVCMKIWWWMQIVAGWRAVYREHSISKASWTFPLYLPTLFAPLSLLNYLGNSNVKMWSPCQHYWEIIKHIWLLSSIFF